MYIGLLHANLKQRIHNYKHMFIVELLSSGNE